MIVERVGGHVQTEKLALECEEIVALAEAEGLQQADVRLIHASEHLQAEVQVLDPP